MPKRGKLLHPEAYGYVIFDKYQGQLVSSDWYADLTTAKEKAEEYIEIEGCPPANVVICLLDCVLAGNENVVWEEVGRHRPTVIDEALDTLKRRQH